MPVEIDGGDGIRLDSLLFGETQSRIVLSLAPEALPKLQEMAKRAGVPLCVLGNVGGDKLSMVDNRLGFWTEVLHLPVTELGWAYRGAIPRLMNV